MLGVAEDGGVQVIKRHKIGDFLVLLQDVARHDARPWQNPVPHLLFVENLKNAEALQVSAKQGHTMLPQPARARTGALGEQESDGRHVSGHHGSQAEQGSIRQAVEPLPSLKR